MLDERNNPNQMLPENQPTNAIVLVSRRFMYSLAVRHLFARTDIIEARLARYVDQKLKEYGQKHGYEKRSVKWLVFAAGLCYYLSSIFLRLAITSVLVSLFYILRVVLPIIYIWFAIAFGWSIGTSVFGSILNLIGIEWAKLWGGMPGQIVSMLPAVLVTAIVMTIYIAIALVIALKYRDSVFSEEIPVS